jgi:hypothetical protein
VQPRPADAGRDMRKLLSYSILYDSTLPVASVERVLSLFECLTDAHSIDQHIGRSEVQVFPPAR